MCAPGVQSLRAAACRPFVGKALRVFPTSKTARGSQSCRGRNCPEACSVLVGPGRLAEARIVLPEDAEVADGVAAERRVRLLADVMLHLAGVLLGGLGVDADPTEAAEKLSKAMLKITVDGLTGKLTWNDKGQVQKDPTAYVITDGKYVQA